MAATVEGFKAAFPHFNSLEEEVVEYRLVRGRREVDETWTEGDRDHGAYLYTAHLLTLEDVLSGGDRALTPRALTGRSLGAASESYAAPAVGAGSSTLDSTVYGKMFEELLRQNQSGPLLVNENNENPQNTNYHYRGLKSYGYS